ncbi:hypothetical protein MtrunA17_Chr3g0114301 [Medicago truncatula]|uniref:Uncharacterized protein n=1 Tax=Medicago truncatula TaxID=3880 RepID=A0A396IVK7_MEDTR|nr:hypothetical protein MtrunA17_Chr3g0114301 [Medicago truncatula]
MKTTGISRHNLTGVFPGEVCDGKGSVEILPNLSDYPIHNSQRVNPGNSA